MRIENAPGLTVTLQHGDVWVTQEGDPNDTCLRAHQSFQLDLDGLAILSARRDSMIQLGAPPAEGCAIRIVLKPTVASEPVTLYDARPARATLGTRLESWRRALASARLTLGGYRQDLSR
jgi:hypothetical protein